MKALLLSVLFLLSFSSFAFVEVECEKSSAPNLYLQIDEPFPSSSTFRWVRLQIENQTSTHNVSLRPQVGFNRLRYWGGGMELEVDLWPDQRPTWGRSYRAEFSSPVGNWRRIPVTCRFPSI